MRRFLFFYTSWYLMNILAVIAIFVVIYGLIWEYSTQNYLRGFTDAIVNPSAPPRQRIEAILARICSSPASPSTPYHEFLESYDLVHLLNSKRMLSLCGTATAAFIYLASKAGIRCRRLLLLNEKNEAKHVVAEVYLDGRWVVVDPVFCTFLQDAQGHFLTKEELRDPQKFKEAISRISGYNPQWTYTRTAYVRVEKIPYLGRLLQRVLNRLIPNWEEMAVGWVLTIKRPSIIWILVGAFMLCFSLIFRSVLKWYGKKRLGLSMPDLGKRLAKACQILFRG